MKPMKYSTLMLALAAALIAMQPAARGETPQDPSNGKVGQMNNQFATDLYAQLAGKDGNIFFSPTSLQTALAMTWAGARGQTAEEMAKLARGLMAHGFENRYRTKDGRYRLLDWTAVPDGGRIHAVMSSPWPTHCGGPGDIHFSRTILRW